MSKRTGSMSYTHAGIRIWGYLVRNNIFKRKIKKKSSDFVRLMVATVIISHLSAVLFKELHTKNVLDCILKSK